MYIIMQFVCASQKKKEGNSCIRSLVITNRRSCRRYYFLIQGNIRFLFRTTDISPRPVHIASWSATLIFLLLFSSRWSSNAKKILSSHGKRHFLFTNLLDFAMSCEFNVLLLVESETRVVSINFNIYSHGDCAKITMSRQHFCFSFLFFLFLFC